jgi:hypothetical protein
MRQEGLIPVVVCGESNYTSDQRCPNRYTGTAPVLIRNMIYLENLVYRYLNIISELLSSSFRDLLLLFTVSTIFNKCERDNWNIIKNKNMLINFSNVDRFLLYPSSQICQIEMGTDLCVPYEYRTRTRSLYVPDTSTSPF